MSIHYSQPKGFVGRNICYAIIYNDVYYGYIVGGSATLHLPGRNEFFNNISLNKIVNNIFYHIFPNPRYPSRNFTIKVLKEFRNRIYYDWKDKYGDEIIGFESLVELPRTGEIYKRDGWIEVGITKGFTCKRTEEKGTDSWTGKRIWNVDNFRPKRVFCRLIDDNLTLIKTSKQFNLGL